MSSRNETFRKPAGNRKYELDTCHTQPRNAWTISRQEHDQWARMVKRFKAEYPEANFVQESLAERFIKTHLLLQRLEDRRCFWDGSESGATKVDKYYHELDAESAAQYVKDIRADYQWLQKELREIAKILLANGININVEGDLSSIFALDDRTQEKLTRYRDGEKQDTNADR